MLSVFRYLLNKQQSERPAAGKQKVYCDVVWEDLWCPPYIKPLDRRGDGATAEL